MHEYGIPQEKALAAMDRMRETETGQKYMAANVPDGAVDFGVWLMLADRKLSKALGITHHEIADWGWRDAFDEGSTPCEAATEALRADDVWRHVLRSESVGV